MTFGQPVLLLGLLAVPAILAAYALLERRGRARRAAFVDAALLAAVAPRRARWRRHVPVVLQVVAVAAVLIALAEPRVTQAVDVDEATIVVATDRSGSMLATDVAPSRLAAARRAAVAFVDAVPDRLRLGAIAFNHQPTVLASPTRDHAAVRDALGTVRAAGSTATGEALAAALRLARSAPDEDRASPAPAAIVLLSDGKSVRGRDVLAVADQARAAKIPVYAVALGTAGGTITGTDGSRREVPPDTATLRRIAQRTGGEAFAIQDAERLTRVYEELGARLSTEDREVEVGSLFAGGALAFLLLGATASIRWFGRPT